MKILNKAVEFEWDTGNKGKNWSRHQVTDEESEEAFFDPRKRVFKDVFHSKGEERYILLGKTKKNRLLYVVFTIRRGKVRIISARDINKKERILYT